MGRADRLAVQQRVEGSMSTVTERISVAIREQIPAYASLADAQRRETEAIATWGVQRLLQLWVEQSQLSEADLRQFRGIGVARGTDGRPLFAVLRAYRVAAVETSALIEELGGPDLQMDDALSLNATMLRGLDDLAEALFAGYTSATERLSGDRAQVLRGLADDLLTGRQTSAATLKDRFEQLDIRVPSSFGLTLLGAEGPNSDVTIGGMAQLASAAAADAKDLVVLSTVRHGQGVLLHSQPAEIPATGRARPWRTCVMENVALPDLPVAYRTAAAAVRHAPSEAGGVNTPLKQADAMLIALLRGEPHVDPRVFAEVALRELLVPAQGHLLEGLRAYLLARSSTGAGKALGLHAQSMRYRLRRLREVTGRDLQSPWDYLLLNTASTIHVIAASSTD